MKPSVYIETSVVSYFVGKPNKDPIIAGHQSATHRFWSLLSRDLSPFVSALVLKESGRGNAVLAQKRLAVLESFAVLPTTPEAEALAQSILDLRGVPKEFPEDALHIAIATVSNMEFIATWNFSHMNNPFTKLTIRRAIEREGFRCPEIVSPDAFLGDVT